MVERIIDKRYWNHREFLDVAREALCSERSVVEVLVEHFTSDNATNQVSFKERRCRLNTVQRRLERYKHNLNKLGIEMTYYRHSKSYRFDYKNARKILDWHYGVDSRYTEPVVNELLSKLNGIGEEEFLDYTSERNFSFIIKNIFEHHLGKEVNINVKDIIDEASNGLLESASLDKFVAMFEKPELLLFAAYPRKIDFVHYLPRLRVNYEKEPGLRLRWADWNDDYHLYLETKNPIKKIASDVFRR